MRLNETMDSFCAQLTLMENHAIVAKNIVSKNYTAFFCGKSNQVLVFNASLVLADLHELRQNNCLLFITKRSSGLQGDVEEEP